MNYQTFQPHPDLASLVKFYWTLEVPYDPNNHKQKIIPDGCVEMTFNMKDPIKRYISDDDFVLHPPAMVMGQRTKSFYIEPLGDVDSFAISFYPYGFANFANIPLKDLADSEIPLVEVLGEAEGEILEQKMIQAGNTTERLSIIETFLLERLKDSSTIENIVKTTVDTLVATNGNSAINTILKNDLSKRRQLERHFRKQVGISPKQLGKVIRLQTALKMLLLDNNENLTNIAYENDYFDQAHFIKDFKSLIGVTPKEFLGNEHMALSTIFYQKDLE